MKLNLSAIILFLVLMASPVMSADTMLIVVRHAEKASDDPKDPGLSDTGKARANKLAQVLKHAGLGAVYATQYQRTQLTGLPSATQAGLVVQVREATRENSKTYAADLLKEIRKKYRGKTVLIVGHSNTVPEIVKLIAGVDIESIEENTFDRLYIITLGKKARLVSTEFSP